MQKSWRIFKSPHDAEVNIGRCARYVLSDACLIPLHLLLVCIRVGIDHLVSASSSLFMAFCQVLHSDKKKNQQSQHRMAIGKYIYRRYLEDFDSID